MKGLVRRRGTVKATASPPTEPEGMQCASPKAGNSSGKDPGPAWNSVRRTGATVCKRSEETYEAPPEAVKPVTITAFRVFT